MKTTNLLFKAIETVFGMSKQVLKGRSRNSEVVTARAYFCYYANVELKISKAAIGRLLERHHSSIINLTTEARTDKRTFDILCDEVDRQVATA